MYICVSLQCTSDNIRVSGCSAGFAMQEPVPRVGCELLVQHRTQFLLWHPVGCLRQDAKKVSTSLEILWHFTESHDMSALMSNASAPDSYRKLQLLRVVFLLRAVQEVRDIANDNALDARIE